MIESQERGLERDISGAPPRRRVRGVLSVALIVLASIMALAGGLTLYAREEIGDSSAFTERAITAVQQPGVQRVVAREITAQVIEPAVPDVVAGRPLIQSAVRSIVGSSLFSPVIRLAALHGHRLLFQRGGGNAVFDIADAGTVVFGALRNLAPGIARDLPKRAEAVLLTLRRRSFATHTLRVAEAVRLLGLVLLPVALLLFVLAIALAPDRRKAITRSGVAIGITGIAFAVTFELFRRYLVSHVYGSDELSNSAVRRAFGDLWDTYLGDLLTWTLVVTVVAWLVAAASASLLSPYSPAATMGRLWTLARRPVSTRARIARGAVAMGLGLFVVLKPTLALRVFAIMGGCVLLYIGAGELLTATAPVRRRPWGLRAIGRRRLATAGGLVAALAAVIAFAVVFTGSASKVQARSIRACNGYAQLCGRRLDEVVFAGTHNSMSAADSPGWLIANQDRPVGEQLRDGIRLFKISTHYGIASPAGRVYTDISSEGNRLNRVAAKLPPGSREALQRFSRSFSGGGSRDKRDIWLCHSLCELGATRMVDYLTTIRRFLELNPDQVIILFDEDYVAERDLNSAFKRAGLYRYLARLQAGQPLPTLAELIRSRHNVVVLAQKPPSGKSAWNADGFTWIQDTPLGAQKPAQFSCKMSRGAPENPLLMMNNWADIFPPRPSPNIPVVKRAFILKRARQCVEQRGRVPNLILTDYYNRGDVVGAVAELNGVGNERPVPTTPVDSSS